MDHGCPRGWPCGREAKQTSFPISGTYVGRRLEVVAPRCGTQMMEGEEEVKRGDQRVFPRVHYGSCHVRKRAIFRARRRIHRLHLFRFEHLSHSTRAICSCPAFHVNATIWWRVLSSMHTRSPCFSRTPHSEVEFTDPISLPDLLTDRCQCFSTVKQIVVSPSCAEKGMFCYGVWPMKHHQCCSILSPRMSR